MIKQKLLSLFVALIAATALWASNTITYTATSQLSGHEGSLNVGKTTFGPAITSHTFSNGTGTITCNGEITTIGDYAFAYCSGLTSVTIPNSVTTIGDFAFYVCSGLTSITIPNSVKTIGNWAFTGLCGLTSVTIGNSVITIGEGAFCDCSGLTSITIPNSVKKIGEPAFINCSGLTSINVDATNTHYTSVDGVLFNYAKDTIIQYPMGNIRTTYTIPNSVRTIERDAFRNCSSLTSVTIPNSVITIGFRAFYGCGGLTSVIIPNSVTTIGSEAFFRCIGLTSVTIPNSVTTIGEYAFSDCYGLTSVTIPNSVTTIGEDAFGVVNNIIYSGTATGSPWGAKCVNGYVDGYLVYSDDTKTTLCGCSSAATGKITIPNSVTTIGEKAFFGCSSLTSVTIPNSVTTIGNDAFYWCNLTRVALNSNAITGTTYSSSNNLTHIFGSQVKTYIIGNDIYSIGEYAFYGSDKITNLVFGSNLTTIGESAFANCNRIDTMTIYAIEPPVITETTFKNVSRYAFLYVPQSSERKYKTDAYWSYFDIQTISAKDTPISGDEVVILPSTDNVTLTWPQNDQAAGYSIEITKDGIVFCTLKFNAQGQLTGIAFAPSRDGEQRTMPAAEMTANGWQFTVTGLNQASKYGYTIDALNANQQSIKHYEGEFYTDGYTGLEDLTIDKKVGNKFIYDNQLYLRRGDKIYNAAGGLMK